MWINGLNIYHKILHFTTLIKKHFENIMEKEGNAGIFFKQTLPLVTHITCTLAEYNN